MSSKSTLRKSLGVREVRSTRTGVPNHLVQGTSCRQPKVVPRGSTVTLRLTAETKSNLVSCGLTKGVPFTLHDTSTLLVEGTSRSTRKIFP